MALCQTNEFATKTASDEYAYNEHLCFAVCTEAEWRKMVV